MPSITARPQPMLIERTDPLAFLLSTVWATTPTPNAIRMKVPKNSAAASRAVPLSMRDSNPQISRMARNTTPRLFHAQDDDVLPRQDVDHLVEHEALGLEFLLHFGDAHLVDFENRHFRILLAELEEDEPAAGFKRF